MSIYGDVDFTKKLGFMAMAMAMAIYLDTPNNDPIYHQQQKIHYQVSSLVLVGANVFVPALLLGPISLYYARYLYKIVIANV